MTAPELKPCPFCGETQPPHDDTSWVRCLGCGAETGWQPTGDDAITAWNRRADLAPPAHVRVKPLGSDGVKIHPQDILNAAWRDDLGHEGRAMYDRILAALEPQPDPRVMGYEQAYQYALTLADALMAKHYPGNKDWQPLGDLTGLLTQIDNMAAGKMPDPRDEVIALAITACRIIDDAVKEGYDTVNGLMMHLLEAVEPARAALAAAKAVQHG